MRLVGIPVGVDGWSHSLSNPSEWNGFQIEMLLENYRVLQGLHTLVIKVEKLADGILAHYSNLPSRFPISQLEIIKSVWSQNKDTVVMRSKVRNLTLAKGWRNFNLAYTVFDDQLDEKDKRRFESTDGGPRCEIDIKRTFQITLWKDTDFEANAVAAVANLSEWPTSAEWPPCQSPLASPWFPRGRGQGG